MTTMVISDVHYPFQDDNAISVMLKIHQYLRPSTTILNGDILDFQQLSKFINDPFDKNTVLKQINLVIELIKKLQKYSNEIIYLEGNHEVRLQKYLITRAPELVQLLDLESIINNKLDKSIEFIKSNGKESYISYDNNNILIGHFNSASRFSAYTARILIDKMRTNIIQGHTHRLGTYYVSGTNGVEIGAESGCLCNLHPQYMLFPNWQNGFLIYQRKNDNINIETIHIQDTKTGKMGIFRGRVFKS